MKALGSHAALYEIKARLFKGLAHPLRIRVLELLAAEPRSPHTVSDLLAATELEPSHLSQHLAVLRHHGLVRSSREGNSVRYELANDGVAELLGVARRFLIETLDATSAQRAAADDLPAL